MLLDDLVEHGALIGSDVTADAAPPPSDGRARACAACFYRSDAAGSFDACGRGLELALC
jgi:hypothetical protein